MGTESRECGKCKSDKAVKGKVGMRPVGQRGVYVCSNGHEEDMTPQEQMSSLGYRPMI